jgi:hypothetical protein
LLGRRIKALQAQVYGLEIQNLEFHDCDLPLLCPSLSLCTATRGCGSADGSALPAAIPPGSSCDAGKVAKRVSNVSLSAGIGYLPTKFAQAEPPATRSRRAATSAPPTAPASASSTGTPPGRRRGGRRDGRVRVAHRAFVWLGWKKISASL